MPKSLSSGHRRKISESMKRVHQVEKNHRPHIRAARVKGRVGVPLSSEHRQKIADAMRNRSKQP